MKKILLAIGNEKFNALLRKPLSAEFTVLNEEVYSRKYLDEFVSDYNPDIIIVHDYYLASEKSDAFEKEVEWLQIIERIRQQYDDEKRIVFICERNPGDPFLSELLNRNVLDIFHNRSLDITSIVEQLKDQPRYSKVAYLKVEDSGKRYKSVGSKLFSFITPTVEPEETEQQSSVEEKDEPVKQEKKLGFSLPKINFPSLRKEKSKEESSENEVTVETETTVETKVEVEVEADTEVEIETPVARRTPIKEQPIEEQKRKRLFGSKETEEVEKDEPVSVVEEEPKKTKKKFSLFGGGKSEEEYNLGTFRPKLIAVGSLHPGAGSTFFLYNFTRYLSDCGVPSAILEGLNDMDALFAIAASELGPKFDWESTHNIVLKQHRQYMYSIPRWNIERTMFLPTLDVEKEQFTEVHAKELVYFARQSPIVFVDISHDWTDPISKEAIAMCDELWCITEPNPMYLEVQRKHHQAIFQVSNRVGEENVIVIGNRWGSGIDVTRFPEIFARIPYVPDNIKALNTNQPAYRLKPKAFADFDKLYDKLIL